MRFVKKYCYFLCCLLTIGAFVQHPVAQPGNTSQQLNRITGSSSVEEPPIELDLSYILWGSALYHGVRVAGNSPSASAFLQGFNRVLLADGTGDLLGEFTYSQADFLTVKMAVSTTTSSIIRSGMGTDQPLRTRAGPFQYNWRNGDLRVVDPIDMDQTFLSNVFSLFSWFALVRDIQRTAYYIQTTRKERKNYRIITREIERGVFEPYSERHLITEEDPLPPTKRLNPLQQYISTTGSPVHLVSRRYLGGLHYGLDLVDGELVGRYHYDAIDALSFGGLGFIPHSLIEVVPQRLGLSPYVRPVAKGTYYIFHNQHALSTIPE